MTDLDKAKKILKSGGIVIYPTDTAFGIGCRIDDEKSVARLFKIRQRPKKLAVPVLVDSLSMAQKYWLSPMPDNVRHLMKRYWPGALTIVYYCQERKVTSLVRGFGSTLGIRMPRHKQILSLIKSVGVPILGPSANFHEHQTPYTMEDLDQDLVQLVDFVLPGKCNLKIASTVVDCTQSPIKILRQGKVDINNV